MKKLYLILFVFLLASLVISCTGTRPSPGPTHATVAPTTSTTTAPTTTPPTTTTNTTTPPPAPPITITPEPVIPEPEPIVPNLEPQVRKYHVKQTITLTNQGPGTVTKLELRAALISSRQPYQIVESEDLWPQEFTRTTDSYGNTFAEYVFNDIWPSEQIWVENCYEVSVNEIENDLADCQGSVPTDYTAPERWMESGSSEIISLTSQIIASKVGLCAQARAIYDWIGDNIAYTSYTARMMGALYCLQNQGGDCTEFSCLMIALSRAAGIPALFTQGVTYIGSSTDTPKHDWTQIYLPGTGWVPVDATWGRYASNRELYFAAVTPDHIIVTTGNPAQLGKYSDEFCYFEYRWWYGQQSAQVSMDEKWEITCISKPETLLCTDEEYETLRAVFESWGFDFISLYDTYSQQGYDNDWSQFWIGSETDTNRRVIFDRVDNMWKPREIPEAPP